MACAPSSLRLVVAAGADLELTVTTTNPGLDASGRQIAFINSPFNSLPIVIAPSALDGTGVLGGDGSADATEAARSGLPNPDFRTDYLISSADPRVEYAATVPPAPASNLMQLALERHSSGSPR